MSKSECGSLGCVANIWHMLSNVANTNILRRYRYVMDP